MEGFGIFLANGGTLSKLELQVLYGHCDLPMDHKKDDDYNEYGHHNNHKGKSSSHITVF